MQSVDGRATPHQAPFASAPTQRVPIIFCSPCLDNSCNRVTVGWNLYRIWYGAILVAVAYLYKGESPTEAGTIGQQTSQYHDQEKEANEKYKLYVLCARDS